MRDKKKKKEPVKKVVQVTDLETDEKAKDVKGGYGVKLENVKITSYQL